MADWQESFPALHGVLASELRTLPASSVEGIVKGVFGEDATLADAEGFFDDLGRTLGGVARAAAPIVQRALPGVVSGAMGGAALGPFGMLGGALLGGLGSAMGGGGARPPGAPAAAPGAPRIGGAGPTGAVGQLLAMLGSPTVQTALGSMLMGPAGARTVATPGGSEVPVGAVTNLLGMLAGRASAEWEALVPSVPVEDAGEALDLMAPEARAGLLFEQLAPLASLAAAQSVDESADESADEALDEAAGDEAWLDELLDEIDAEDAEAAFDEAAFDEAAGSWSLSHG